MVDAQQALRRHPAGPRAAGTGRHRAGGAGHRGADLRDRAPAAAQDAVDSRRQASIRGGRHLLRVPADHRHQHPLLLRADPHGGVPPGRGSRLSTPPWPGSWPRGSWAW